MGHAGDLFGSVEISGIGNISISDRTPRHCQRKSQGSRLRCPVGGVGGNRGGSVVGHDGVKRDGTKGVAGGNVLAKGIGEELRRVEGPEEMRGAWQIGEGRVTSLLAR